MEGRDGRIGPGHTTQTLQPLDRQPTAFPEAVRAQLVQDTRDSGRVRQQARRLAHAAVRIDRAEVARVQERVPARKVDEDLLDLRSRVRELGEEPPGHEVVVILIDLPQCIAEGQV